MPFLLIFIGFGMSRADFVSAFAKSHPARFTSRIRFRFLKAAKKSMKSAFIQGSDSDQSMRLSLGTWLPFR